METIQQIDSDILFFINSLHSGWLDQVMIFFSGKLTWAPLYLFIIYSFYKKYKIASWKIILLVILGITLSDRISSGFAKPFFERLRPCHNEAIIQHVHFVISCGGKYGFFSSHASNAFFIAVFSYLVLDKKWRVWLLPWATLVALSRVYLVKHYFTDILVGALCGTLVAWAMYAIAKRLFKTKTL